MRIAIMGYGRMGRLIEELAVNDGHEIAARVNTGSVSCLAALPAADVAIDFSSPSLLPAAAEYVKRTGTPLLSGTTGGADEFFAELSALSQYAPVLYSANYSLGIAVLRRILPTAAKTLLPGFDVEIIETHHRMKADAPGGTAKLLADVIDPEGNLARVYGREGRCKRTEGEIGIHAIRGGTVVGDHTVSFFGPGETLSFTHSAASRSILAQGALAAASRLIVLEKGFYSLDEVLFGEAQS